MDFSNKGLYVIIRGKKSVSGNPYPEDYEEYLKAREADLKWVIDEADARTKFHELRAEDLRNQHHPVKAFIEERKAAGYRGASNNTYDKYWDTQDKRELLTQMKEERLLHQKVSWLLLKHQKNPKKKLLKRKLLTSLLLMLSSKENL